MKLKNSVFRVCLACWTLFVSIAVTAGQVRDTNETDGLSTSIGLRHRVVIPQILYFRIGDATPGVIDKLRFNATPGGAAIGDNQTYSGGPSVPLFDGTPISADGGGALNVQIESNVGSVVLSYDLSDPAGLVSANGDHIPFDEIDVQSADAAGLPTPPLANAGAGGAFSVSISGNQFGGRVIRRRTQWTYTYKNSQSVPAGTYNGRVRYTVSSP